MTGWCTDVLSVIVLMGLTVVTTQAIANVNVPFQVKMNIKLLEGTFKPGSGDIVKVNGTFNNWDSSTDTLKDADGDSVYTKTVFLTMFVGDTIYYKFWKSSRGGINYEATERVHIIASVDDTLAAPFFDQDSVLTPPLDVTFQVRMSIKMREGTFQPGSGDIVSVNGDFNG